MIGIHQQSWDGSKIASNMTIVDTNQYLPYAMLGNTCIRGSDVNNNVFATGNGDFCGMGMNFMKQGQLPVGTRIPFNVSFGTRGQYAFEFEFEIVE